MAGPTFRRWTADEITKLRSLARRLSTAEIAGQLGRSPSATAVKAHELRLSLRVRNRREQPDPGPVGLVVVEGGRPEGAG